MTNASQLAGGITMNTTIIICCYCDKQIRIVDPKDRTYGYDYCPHCKGRFSFDAPRVVDLGGNI